MKRSTTSADLKDHVMRAPKLVKFRDDTLHAAVAQACSTLGEDGEIWLPASPLILMGISEDAEVGRLAYWPPSAEVGLRVLDALEKACGTNENGNYYVDNVTLVDLLWDVAADVALAPEDLDFVLKRFGVGHLLELGHFKPVLDKKKKKVGGGALILSELSPRLYTKVYHRFC